MVIKRVVIYLQYFVKNDNFSIKLFLIAIDRKTYDFYPKPVFEKNYVVCMVQLKDEQQ